MHKLYELKEKLMRELEDYSENGKFSKDDVESIKYITSSIDHICNIMESAEDEYSMNMMGGGSYEGGSYEGGSYARRGMGGRSNARGGRGGSRGRGGNRGANQYGSYGYSRAEDISMELRELMNEAPDDRTRQEIQNLIHKLDRM